MGVVGIETSFPLMYTNFVKTGMLSLEKLMDLMCFNARKRFNIPLGDSFTVWDLNNKYKINPNDFVSKGKSTPFESFEVCGKCLLTVKDGKIVWINN